MVKRPSVDAQILGRLPCNVCGFEAAHVKRRPEKRPFIHCPQCSATTPAKSGHQEECMLRRMRPEGTPPPAAPAVAAPAIPEPPRADRPIIVRGGVKVDEPSTAPAAPPRPRSWADQLLNGGKA